MAETTDLFEDLDDPLVEMICERLLQEQDCRTLAHLIRTNQRFLRICSPMLEQLKDPPREGHAKMTGYQLFIRNTLPILKEQGNPAKNSLTATVTLWKSLSEHDKMIWKLKAKYPNCHWY